METVVQPCGRERGAPSPASKRCGPSRSCAAVPGLQSGRVAAPGRRRSGAGRGAERGSPAAAGPGAPRAPPAGAAPSPARRARASGALWRPERGTTGRFRRARPQGGAGCSALGPAGPEPPRVGFPRGQPAPLLGSCRLPSVGTVAAGRLRLPGDHSFGSGLAISRHVRGHHKCCPSFVCVMCLFHR